MNHLHTARRLTTGLAAGAVLSTGLAAGATAATATEPEPAATASQVSPALVEDLLGLLIQGLGQVGETLSVPQPTGIPGVSEWQIEWLRDDIAIPGADDWSYLPTLEDAGHVLQARVTGLLLGLPVIQGLTQFLPIPFPGQEDETPQATAQPTVTGTAKVGQQLTGGDPTWDADGVSNAYQWLRNGSPISGATAKTYLLTVEDAGKQVALKVTGTKGSATGIATSAPVSVQPADAPTATAPVRISGQGRVGETLEALDPTWSGSGAITTTFQWLRDGLSILGATGRTYRVTAEDIGTRISVRATGARTGHAPGTSTSDAVLIDRTPTTTRATLARTSVGRGQRAVLKVVVKARGGDAATGRVSVREGRRQLKAVVLRASHQGRVSLKLPRLAPGRHRLKVGYAGSSTLEGSAAKVVVLTVRR